MTFNMTSITRMDSIHSWLLQVSELYLPYSSMGIINDHPWAFRSTRGYLFSDRTADSHPDGGEYSRQESSYDPCACYARKFPATAQPPSRPSLDSANASHMLMLS